MARHHQSSTPSITRRRLSLVLAVVTLVLVGPLVVPASAAGAFWDDDLSVHEQPIEGIAAAGITRGCDPPARSAFCATSPLERGEMAAFINRAVRLPATGRDYFDDDDGSIYEDDINRLAAAGITRGCNPPANTRFCPERLLPRDQMATFLDRVYDPPATTVDRFDDDDGSVHEAAINRIAAAGITVGCNPDRGGNRYCPDDVVRREQMASFIVRADDDVEALDPGRLHERTVTYDVRGIGASVDRADVALLGRRAEEALYAHESWNIQHRLLIEQVDGGGDFTLWITDEEIVGEQADVCVDEYSCTVGDDLYINHENFDDPPGTWSGRSTDDYQRYVVLHEVGHFLDFDGTADGDDDSHYNDVSYCVDGRAPTMKQQSISLDGCSTNVYPLPFERDCVEEAWLADTTDQGDGDGDDDDQCPHSPAER